MKEECKFQIVVLDRGFVYVGHTTIDGDMIKIAGARCIRRWGTDPARPGLAYLAANGPTKNTKLDGAVFLSAPMRAVILLIDVQEEEKWASKN